MYNINKTTDSEGGSVKFLDSGIHENVLLTNVEYKTSEAGNDYLVFTFEKEGRKVNLTEWKPSDTEPEKLANKETNQGRRVKHIVTKFISEDAYIIEGADFKSFCEDTVRLLGDAYKGVKVRIKVIYNYNNFTTLPRYVPFIEQMSVPKAESKLEILSIDKMTKDRADTEIPSTNPVEVLEPLTNEDLSKAGADTSGLPF